MIGIGCVIAVTVAISLYVSIRMADEANIATRWILVWSGASLLKIAAVCLLFAYFGTATDRVWVDSAEYLNVGSALASGAVTVPELLAQMGWPPHIGYELFVSLLIRLFGYNELTVSLANVLLSIVAAYLLYEISGYFVDKKTAFAGSLLFQLYPTMVEFSFYVLKDVSVVTMVELALLFYLRAKHRGKAANIAFLFVSLLALAFLRSFYAILLVLVILFDMSRTRGKGWGKWAQLAAILAFLAGLVRIAGAGTVMNMGYTIGTGDAGAGESGLSFLSGFRLEPSLASVSAFAAAVAAHLPAFLSYAARMAYLVLWGPTYWYAGSGGALFYKYGRYVFFENLGSMFMTLLLPGFLYALIFHKSVRHRGLLACFALLLFLSLLVGSDIRWKLAFMPVVILLSAAGFREIAARKTAWKPGFLLYWLYLFSFALFVGIRLTV